MVFLGPEDVSILLATVPMCSQLTKVIKALTQREGEKWN